MQLHVAITDPNRHTSSDLTRRVGGDKQNTQSDAIALATPQETTDRPTVVASRRRDAPSPALVDVHVGRPLGK